MPKPYHSLTEIGQARRLRTLAQNALAQYDLNVSRLRLITNDFNGIFRVDTHTGEKFVLRVTLPEGGHTAAHVAAEIDWLAALARDTHLSVPRPIAARDGSLIVTAQAQGVPQPRLCEVFSWVPGKDLADAMTPENIAKWGELMAHLHLHARTYQPLNPHALLRFDTPFPFPEPVVFFDEQHAELFPPARRATYQKAIAWVETAIQRLQASGEPMHILHGDLHQWNVRLARGTLSPIDFEDLMLGWAVQDIATTWYYFPDENFAEMTAAFQRGYTRIHEWQEQYPGEIAAFIAARDLGMANFILNDPSTKWSQRAQGYVARAETRLLNLMHANGQA